jgi:hypothetical protein
MSAFDPAPYMRWAKTRPTPRHDLAGSNLRAVTPDEVGGLFDGVAYSGPNEDGYLPVRQAIAGRYRVDVEQVALGSGCSGANALAILALVEPGDDVVVERPVYDPLPAAVRMAGGSVRFFDRRFEERWAVVPERVLAAMTPRTRLVVVTSPHNPTGVAMPAASLRALGEIVARAGAYALVDEVYLDALHRGAPVPAARVHPRLISTSSLTKSYGLGGLRCGWALAGPDVAARIRRARDAFDAVGAFPCEVASARAFAALEELARRASAILAPNLDRLSAFVASRPELEWVRPDGGTVAFPRLTGVRDSGAFVERLLRDHGVAVVPGRLFGEPAHFRIAFGIEPDAFALGLEALDRAVGSA